MAVKDNGHIFVSIASYRDSQCQYTIRDMFEKARFPERIVAGVCHQVAPDDHECFMLDLDHWASQIRTYFLPHTDSKGPCFARAMIQKHLMQDEEFYFQIDSHMRFVLHWDQVLLDQLDACPSPRPVITSLQASYELPRDYQPGEPDRAALSRRHGMTLLCADKFGDQCPGQDDAFLRIGSRLCLGEVSSPPPALFWTARFHFSRSLAARECPYDPYLDYIFFGEEISMAARLFTSGWDCFNPTKVICYHLQSRSHRPFYTEAQSLNALKACLQGRKGPCQTGQEARALHVLLGGWGRCSALSWPLGGIATPKRGGLAWMRWCFFPLFAHARWLNVGAVA